MLTVIFFVLAAVVVFALAVAFVVGLFLGVFEGPLHFLACVVGIPAERCAKWLDRQPLPHWLERVSNILYRLLLPVAWGSIAIAVVCSIS